jgi:cell wall-associated NlpC family hydrolase
MDCSGFTSVVYLLNGLVLPRDASQQVLAGEAVPFGDGFDAVQPGDLLFFGRAATAARPARVTHVAMSLGGPRFIHASIDVRKNSFDPQDPDYSESLRKILLQIRRVRTGQGVAKLADMPYYATR